MITGLSRAARWGAVTSFLKPHDNCSQLFSGRLVSVHLFGFSCCFRKADCSSHSATENLLAAPQRLQKTSKTQHVMRLNGQNVSGQNLSLKKYRRKTFSATKCTIEWGNIDRHFFCNFPSVKKLFRTFFKNHFLYKKFHEFWDSRKQDPNNPVVLWKAHLLES